MPRDYGRKPGLGHKVPHPLPLAIICRLADWALENHEGFEIEGKASPCWIWQGHCDKDGYAEMKWRGKKYRAARVAYTGFIGPIQDGLDVDHLCLCRACINPAHLEAVDPFTNRVVRRNSRREELPI